MSWKKKSVVMLPTISEAGSQADYTNGAKLVTFFGKGFFKLWKTHDEFGYSEQNIYILSDEQIKEGDWFYDELSDFIGKAIKKEGELWVVEDVAGHLSLSLAKKIVASTDKSLGLLIPQEFVELYAEEYNEGKPITEVMIEYEGVVSSTTWEYDEPEEWRPKVDERNVVIIRKIKDSWTREELLPILTSIMNLGMSLRQDQLNGYSDKSGNEVLVKWIEENL